MSARHNRQDPADYLKGHKTRLHDSFATFFGDPLKYTGTGPGAASGGPAYDSVLVVAPYDDTSSRQRCLGVSDSQILSRGGAYGSEGRATYDALYKSQNEWRHGDRSVAIVVHGVRDMINKGTGTIAYDNDEVAPYPGGFIVRPRDRASAMTYLGRVKSGPIAFLGRGPIIIEPRHDINDEEGWLDNGVT